MIQRDKCNSLTWDRAPEFSACCCIPARCNSVRFERILTLAPCATNARITSERFRTSAYHSNYSNHDKDQFGIHLSVMTTIGYILQPCSLIPTNDEFDTYFIIKSVSWDSLLKSIIWPPKTSRSRRLFIDVAYVYMYVVYARTRTPIIDVKIADKVSLSFPHWYLNNCVRPNLRFDSNSNVHSWFDSTGNEWFVGP